MATEAMATCVFCLRPVGAEECGVTLLAPCAHAAHTTCFAVATLRHGMQCPSCQPQPALPAGMPDIGTSARMVAQLALEDHARMDGGPKITMQCVGGRQAARP